MKKTQFAEKVRGLGYHVNEFGNRAEIYLHGDYVCSIPYYNKYEVRERRYVVPSKILELVDSYGDL
ncbi:hypothetical protein LMH73_014730 [Vibrio splendidus]|nr:hypothetical protein [Vibrio splendidus]MCC4882929.1 hypothetical protein [Vibrio splendidus]